MSRPVIGITCCTRPFGEESAQVVIDRYMEAAVRYADAAALLIPARPDLMSAEEVADRIDGLLLTGSPSNVAPELYGADGGDGPFDRGRDAMTFALIEAMTARGKPILGICRGFQELNVAFGGTLDGSLGDQDRPIPHHAPDGVPLAPMFAHGHDVSLTEGGLLNRAFGRSSLAVNSVHFQGVDRLAPGFAVEATAPDGVIEAISAQVEQSMVLGVQWHPEWQTDRDAASIGLFGLFGRILRGQPPIATGDAALNDTKEDA